MRPEPDTLLIVVDVGNTRIKWGWCAGGAVRKSAALPPDDAVAWQQQLEAWTAADPLTWVVSGVHPGRRDRLVDWLRRDGHAVQVVTSGQQLPLDIGVTHPDKVGIDRLLNAVAVNARRPAGSPAVIVDAGSALPLIQPVAAIEVPGTTTTAAMKAGIFCAVLGGIKETIQRLVPSGPMLLVLGGGDGPLLGPHLPWPAEIWPLMTLEGLRLTARNLP
jgi:type III pantothenate kinase